MFVLQHIKNFPFAVTSCCRLNILIEMLTLWIWIGFKAQHCVNNHTRQQQIKRHNTLHVSSLNVLKLRSSCLCIVFCLEALTGQPLTLSAVSRRAGGGDRLPVRRHDYTFTWRNTPKHAVTNGATLHMQSAVAMKENHLEQVFKQARLCVRPINAIRCSLVTT